ncbi:MAG: family 16 glycosylhydrolase [Bacteroidales bacterium]|nr:family 16 glycosylhydrolase [Bacteroidales bacterium]
MKNRTLLTLLVERINRIWFRSATLLAIIVLFSQVSVAQSWVLKWQDNFETGTLDQTNTWNLETDGNGGGNSELQYYIPDNVTIESYQGLKCLVLSAKKETYLNKNVTSGRLNSQGKVYFQYGKIESRMKLPSTANGLWPAFWFLGNDYVYDINAVTSNWPVCGEIDVMECGNSAGIANNTQSTNMGGALHWGPTPGNTNHSMDYTNVNAPYSIQDDEFHLYTLIWDADSIKMYLDQDRYPKVKPFYKQRIQNGANTPNAGGGNFTIIYNQFHKPFHIVYNLAVGGTYVGIYDINSITALAGGPAKMYIDYIRIYQKGDAGELFTGPSISADSQVPTLTTATLGTVTKTTAEILLNGSDNSGSVIYTVSYNGNTTSTESASGALKSYIVTGLSAGTTYNFTITATDANGNVAGTSWPVTATTLANTECAGLSNAASNIGQNGFLPFETGYSYTFTTSGTDVIVTFEMLDSKEVANAYLWNFTSSFSENKITTINGKIFSYTLSKQTIGSKIKVACKFEVPGGSCVTQQLTYTVGNACVVNTAIETEQAAVSRFYPNPLHTILHLQLPDDKNLVVVNDMIGNLVLREMVGSSGTIDMSHQKTGVYILRIENKYGIRYQKLIKN